MIRKMLPVAVALLAAGCAHTHADAPTETTVQVDVAAAEHEPAFEAPERPLLMRLTPESIDEFVVAPGLRDPVKSRERLRHFMNPEPRDESGERIEFEARPSGWAFGELFRLVSEETGATILYDTHNAIIKGKKVSFTGTQRVARDESLGWLQDVCSTHGLVLIPHSVPKRNAWFAVDQANPQTSTRPTFIAEDDLPDYVGRSGLYIVSVLTVPDGIEPGRVRQALSQLSTKTAGLGRINDVGEGISLIVADFAHIVATMRRTLDEMAVRRWEHAQGR